MYSEITILTIILAKMPFLSKPLVLPSIKILRYD